MRQISIELYKYDELSEQAKEIALEHYRDINVDWGDWYDDTLECLKDMLQEKGFDNAEINFDVSYSQGSGASFTSDIDIKKYIEQYNNGREQKEFLKVLENINDVYASVERSDSRYYHERTIYVQLDDNFANDEMSEKYYNELLDEMSKLEKFLSDEIVELSKMIYKTIRDEHDDLTSDEMVAETIVANEYDFTIDGKSFCTSR